MTLTRVPDLDTLSLLLEIAASGSLSKAGASRGLSQPAVSARVRGLERLVGFAVLTRSARGSNLTPNGALLASGHVGSSLLRTSSRRASRPCAATASRGCGSRRA